MRKKDTFIGGKLLVLPKKVKKKLRSNNLTNYLYITDIGYFPNGKHHYRARRKGSQEHILIYCVDGKGWIEIDGTKQFLSKNMYSIIPKETPHTYAADQNNPWTIYWTHFLGDKADSFVYPLNYPRELKETNVSRFKDRIELFEEIYFNLDAGYSDQNMEYSSILLMHLLGSFKYLSQFRKIKEIQQQDVISKAIVFIKSNLHRKLSLSEIANYSNVSVSHLCLLFKKKTSYSPVEYLIFMRMQKACSLLEFTSLKINTIANNVGYEDAFYFSRLFKNVIGKSPSQYRISTR